MFVKYDSRTLLTHWTFYIIRGTYTILTLNIRLGGIMKGRFRQYLSASGNVLLFGAALMVETITVVFGGEHALSRTEFCVSCHSQTYPYEELKKSSHYGALGADPGCKDCHVPQGLGKFHLALRTHL